MTDVSVPLNSRRPGRMLLPQRLQHVTVALVLLAEGVRRLTTDDVVVGQALGSAEIGAAMLVLVACLWSLRAGANTVSRPQEIDWVELALAILFGVDVWTRHYESGQWSRPTLALAGVTLVLALLHGRLSAFATRRRGIRLTNRRISIGGRPFRRFTAPWADISKIDVGARWAVITTHSGQERRIDLGDVEDEPRVREALREAEILRTAKRRFAPKAAADAAPLHRPEAPPAAPPAASPPVPSPAPPLDATVRFTRQPPTLIGQPSVIESAGNLPKRIEEYAGRVNSRHRTVSVARMVSPEGWLEPGQRPEFEEITVVLRGVLRVEHDGGAFDVRAGQAVVAHPGEWIRYSSPSPGGAEYVAVCQPAFSPETVHRDPESSAADRPHSSPAQPSRL